MEVSQNHFHIVDYVVFVFMFLISIGIGVYFGFAGRKQKTTDDYLMGGRQLSLIPVALSLVVSVVSANTLLGAPAETYNYGIMYWLILIGLVPATVIVAVTFVPLFYPTKVTSANEVRPILHSF